MSARWLLAGVAMVAGFGLAATDVGRSIFAAQNQRRPRPRVIASERHDRSPVLRTMRPMLPPSAPTSQIPRHARPKPRIQLSPQPAAPDSVVQTFAAAPAMPAPSESFDGVGNISSVLPSDANGDVGPSHFFQTVNISLAIYSKGTGTMPPELLYGPFAGSTLWQGFGGPCETNDNGDPIVMYDHLADRWFVSQLALPNLIFGIPFAPFYQCIAVSTSPDPTGTYFRYQFAFDKLNDYPKFGLWSDGYYMAINQFEEVTLQFAGQGVIAIDRARMLAGQPASMVYFDLWSTDENLGGMLPADLDGMPAPAGSPAYFMQVDDDAWGYGPDQLQLWRFHVDWTNPSASTFTGPTVLPTAPFDSDLCGYEPCVPQPGTAARLDTLSDRLMYRLQYRNFGTHETLVVNHSVDADGQDHAGLRWYEVRDPRNAPLVYQQGTYAPDSNHRTFGSAAMDRAGNLAMGFTASGQAVHPSMRYTGRLAGDSPGLLTQGEADLVAGSGSQTHASGRWGDYAALVVDPSDGCTFWYTSQYYSATSDAGWRTRIGSFAFPSCLNASGPPAVTVTATTPVATEARTAAGRFTFTRTGDTTGALTLRYTVEGTATIDGDYVALSETVTIPAGARDATLDVTPLDDAFAENDETVVLSLQPHESYFVSAPGGGIVRIASDDAPGDLVVSALAPPAVGGAGAPIAVTETTKNQEAGAAAASTTAFYLSTNSSLGSTDVLFGTRAAPSLAAGQSHAAVTSLTVPEGTTVGTYYIVAKADANSEVVETQESNNTRSASIRIGPDLKVATLTAPATAIAGATIAVSDTTTNAGGGWAAASVTGFYLSGNSTLDSADVPLGTRPVPALEAAASHSASSLLTVPATTTGGTYYVIAKADGNSTVIETIESNTKASSSMRIGADLTVSLLTPAPAGAGTPVVITDTTRNQGAAGAEPSSTAFYLSPNVALDGADVLLGARAVPALEPGATHTASTTLQIPDATATGTYYVIGKADAGGGVPESLEGNNTDTAILRVGPDLVVSSTSGPGSAVSGTSITVTDTTRNQGGGPAPASATRFYLSTNASFDALDTPLGVRFTAPLAAGATSVGSATLAIPAGLATANYYIVAVADGEAQVGETLENNNTRAMLLRVNAAP